MSTTPKESTTPKLVHNSKSRCSQKKKEQKENEESSPLMDKSALKTKFLMALSARRLTHNLVAVSFYMLAESGHKRFQEAL